MDSKTQNLIYKRIRNVSRLTEYHQTILCFTINRIPRNIKMLHDDSFKLKIS